MPALKKTRVWPSLYFSLSSLTMSITAWAAALSFGLSHGGGTDDVVAGLELGIG